MAPQKKVPSTGSRAPRYRFAISLGIVVLAFMSVLSYHIQHRLFWPACQIVCVFAAGAGLLMAVLAPLGEFTTRWSLCWRQVCHWLGYLSLVFFIQACAQMGVLSTQSAGVCVLAVTGFVFYFAGLYVDALLILVGCCCIALAASMVWVHAHFILLAVAIFIFALLLVKLMDQRRHSV